MIISKCSATHIRVISADTNLGDQGYGTVGLTRSVLDESQPTMPVKFSTNAIRVNGTCMNQGVAYHRFLEYHTKKDTLVMSVDMFAEIHVVCERHRRRLYGRTTVKDVAINFGTADGSVPILGDGSPQKSNGVIAHPCDVDPLATHSPVQWIIV